MRRLAWTIGLAAMAMVLAPTPVPAQSTPTAEQCEIAPLDRDELREIVESGFDAIPESRRAKAFGMNDRGWTAQAANLRKFLSA